MQRERSDLGQVLQLLLLMSLWSVWLLVRLAWTALGRLVGEGSRIRLGRAVAWLVLAGLILLGPHAVAFGWSWLSLTDAAEVCALQAAGREAGELEVELRRRAFRLGFTDILEQPAGIQVEHREREGMPACRVRIDFRQVLEVYGWRLPPLRIRVEVERFTLPRRNAEDASGLLLSRAVGLSGRQGQPGLHRRG